MAKHANISMSKKVPWIVLITTTLIAFALFMFLYISNAFANDDNNISNPEVAENVTVDSNLNVSSDNNLENPYEEPSKNEVSSNDALKISFEFIGGGTCNIIDKEHDIDYTNKDFICESNCTSYRFFLYHFYDEVSLSIHQYLQDYTEIITVITPVVDDNNIFTSWVYDEGLLTRNSTAKISVSKLSSTFTCYASARINDSGELAKNVGLVMFFPVGDSNSSQTNSSNHDIEFGPVKTGEDGIAVFRDIPYSLINDYNYFYLGVSGFDGYDFRHSFSFNKNGIINNECYTYCDVDKWDVDVVNSDSSAIFNCVLTEWEEGYSPHSFEYQTPRFGFYSESSPFNYEISDNGNLVISGVTFDTYYSIDQLTPVSTSGNQFLYWTLNGNVLVPGDKGDIINDGENNFVAVYDDAPGSEGTVTAQTGDDNFGYISLFAVLAVCSLTVLLLRRKSYK